MKDAVHDQEHQCGWQSPVGLPITEQKDKQGQLMCNQIHQTECITHNDAFVVVYVDVNLLGEDVWNVSPCQCHHDGQCMGGGTRPTIKDGQDVPQQGPTRKKTEGSDDGWYGMWEALTQYPPTQPRNSVHYVNICRWDPGRHAESPFMQNTKEERKGIVCCALSFEGLPKT